MQRILDGTWIPGHYDLNEAWIAGKWADGYEGHWMSLVYRSAGKFYREEKVRCEELGIAMPTFSMVLLDSAAAKAAGAPVNPTIHSHRTDLDRFNADLSHLAQVNQFIYLQSHKL